jgi:hypothetical protein
LPFHSSLRDLKLGCLLAGGLFELTRLVYFALGVKTIDVLVLYMCNELTNFSILLKALFASELFTILT